MTGLGRFLAVLLRARWRRSVIWVLAVVGSLAGTALSIASLYDTPAKIASYGAAVVSDALVAINGRVEGIDSLGGIVQDEFGFLASFLMPLVGIALVASTTRGEEESGRLEVLLAGRTDRRAPVVASLLLALAVVGAIVVGFVVSLLVAGIAVDDAVLYALGLGLLALVFAALAAVCAQLVLHSRTVYLLGFAVAGAAYLLRGVGDVTHTPWSWLSPLGWVEKSAPFAVHQRWWVLTIPLLVSAVLAVTAVVLAGRRDLGSAAYRPGPGPAAASSWLVHPAGLAAATQRGAFLGWLVGSVALAAMMGALAQQVVDAVAGNPSLRQALGMTEGAAADGFLSVVEIYLAILACGYVVQALGTLRREEAEGRLEPALAGALSRNRWLAAQLLVVVGGLVVLVFVSAGVLGIATAVSTGHAGYVGTLVGAGLAYLPGELVVAAVAALLFGIAPRGFTLAWVGFGSVAVIGLLGPGLRMPSWMLDLSPLSHVGTPPQGTVQAEPLALLTLLALVGATAAFGGFRRRRVPSA